jgi:hypothetical protein
MLRIRRLLIGATALAVFCLMSAPRTASAGFVMLLAETGGPFVFVSDNGAGDMNPLVGAITFSGPLGVFNVNVSTGLSKPIFPASTTSAHMDLNSVNVSTATGQLVIAITDTDFPAWPTNGTLIGAVGGTTDGTASFRAWKDPSNVEFATGGTTIFLGPFGPGAFSGTTSAVHGPLPTYSMTVAALIDHGPGVNVTSFDFDVVNVVPEPASFVMLALGGLPLLVHRLRRRKVAA